MYFCQRHLLNHSLTTFYASSKQNFLLQDTMRR